MSGNQLVARMQLSVEQDTSQLEENVQNLADAVYGLADALSPVLGNEPDSDPKPCRDSRESTLAERIASANDRLIGLIEHVNEIKARLYK